MARLKVRRHQQAYAELTLVEGEVYTVGRKDDCDVVLQPDPGISRTHFTIEKINSKWTIKVLSQHMPVAYSGKNHTTLVCNESPLHFSVTPYDFEMDLDLKLENSSVEKVPEEANQVDEKIIAKHAHESNPAIDAEVSFIGNEEKTSDISLTSEPYLKFMYSSHSESIRLKGNKWIAGRDNIAQIALDDKKASRQHFSIEKVGDHYYIKDLKSANGTLLNGQELVAHEVRDLKSGDIITVNQLTMIFELRDLSFSEKLKDLPLQAYSAPMILSSQEWDVQAPAPPVPTVSLPVQQLAQLPGTAEKITAEPKNKMRPLLIAVAVAVVALGVYFNMEPEKPKVVSNPQVKTFESLSPEEKKIVVDSYTAAQNYFNDNGWQNAIKQLERIHSLLPSYKDSRDLETRSQEALETFRQQEYIAQQLREQERTRQKVISIVADCRDRFKNSVDINAARACLNEATQLDPENAEAQSIIAEIELRLSQAEEAERRLREFNDSVTKGRELYAKATTLLHNKEYHEAISAFAAHINANLPDPDRLKQASQRSMASIEHMISSQKNGMMSKARSSLSGGNSKDAILFAEQAKKIDPFDYSILNFIEANTRDLEARMRLLYTESVIEERFGNLDLCRNKWKEIIEKDIPSGVYYKKAKQKMQQYGL